MAYDPVKRRERYLRTRELVGRKPGSGQTKSSKSEKAGAKVPPSDRERASAKIARLSGKVDKLNKKLLETKKILAEKRRDAQKSRETQRATEKKNSDGKSSAAEKAASKKYRDKNRGKIASKSKSSGSSTSSSSTKPSDMSIEQLEDRVINIEATIKMAKAQVRKASKDVGSLKHSASTSTASSFGVGLKQTNHGKETVKMAVTLDKTPDFGGWATKAGLECADGLTIGHDAFKDMDGVKVPLVYQHGHDHPDNLLGHAILENRGEGVYAHCYFNGSNSAQSLSHAVSHDDITMMSIYANRLRKTGNTVIHGIIREVSLVVAGANPGALIDFVSIRHADGEYEQLDSEAVITTGLEIKHSEETEGESEQDPDAVWNSMTPAQQELTQQMLQAVASSKQEDDEEDSEEDPEESNEQEEDSEEESTEENSEEGSEDNSTEEGGSEDGSSDANASADGAPAAQHDALNKSDDLKGSEMTETLTHNVFDQDAAIKHGLTGIAKDNKYVLSHSDKDRIFSDALASRSSSLKDVVEGYKLSHGIENVDILFPDAKAVSDVPEWVRRRTEWVDRVLNGAKHTPFSRIKSLSADLTLDKARAKGYIKGALKKEEFFSVAKRVTLPQTIYKKQKLDRDDILDITDFDVVVWLKGEMRLMLDEELARAILIGDGRSNADDDKILEDKIRPIATDHELFQTTVQVSLGANADAEQIVDAILLNRRHYRGSGNPDLFTKEEYISRILNVKDSTGRRIYANLSELASTLRVNSIIPVEVMEEEQDLVAIMVNMVDYTIGTDRGGNVSLFDDFDIDYNQYKYLIETRCSGALTKPKSALVVRRSADNATAVVPEAPAWDGDAHSVTVADTAGLVYKNQSNGAVLASGTPVVLTEDQTMTVIAVPADADHYIESTAMDEFTFTYDEGLVDGPH